MGRRGGERVSSLIWFCQEITSLQPTVYRLLRIEHTSDLYGNRFDVEYKRRIPSWNLNFASYPLEPRTGAMQR